MEHDESKRDESSGVSRREFVGVAVAGGVAAALPGEAQTSAPAQVAKLPCEFKINGQQFNVQLDPRTSLLDLLRENLQLTGTKKGCDHGQCGACTVMVDGQRINSCLTLAVMQSGREVITIEGLAEGATLHPVQAAFIEHDGFQCGYCTPGQICSAVALLQEVKSGAPSAVTRDLAKTGSMELTDDEIKERMSGNICRCGAYAGIVAAIKQAYQGARA